MEVEYFNMNSKALEEKKKIFRDKFMLKRNQIIDKIAKSSIIESKVLNCEEYKKAKVVALYMSLESEVNTKELIKKTIDLGKIVVLPKVDGEELFFYRIDSLEDNLRKGKFGIIEPMKDESKFINKDEIDLIIVPGICFDKSKNRLGFGKGYYDRLLNIVKAKTIAICYEEQISHEELPTGKYDMKVQKIITDKKIYF